MTEDFNYFVDMKADFPWPESADEPAGEELANILAAGLPRHGIEVVKVEGDEYCYWVECLVGATNIDLNVSAEMLDDQHHRWQIIPWKQPNSSFGRREDPDPDYRVLMLAIDPVLKECDRISDIRWFPTYETPDYLALLPHSSGPIRDPDYEARLHPLIRLDQRIERITELFFRPLGFTLAIVFVLLIVNTFPHYAGQITGALFLGFVILAVIIPNVLTSRVGREAKRISSKRDP